MSHSLLGRPTNLSYYTVPVAWALCLAPHVYAIKLYDRLSPTQKFDGANPRTFLAAIEANPDLETPSRERLARAEGAQLNGFENLGFFAAGVVAANASGVDTWWLNALSFAYLFNRALFNVLYISGVRGPVRGAPFYASIG